MTEPATVEPAGEPNSAGRPFGTREKIELAVLVGLYVIAGYFMFTEKSQLLTPPPPLWRWGMLLFGLALGARILYLGATCRLWIPNNEAFSVRPTRVALNLVAGGVLLFLTFATWQGFALTTSSAYQFRDGGMRRFGSFRVLRLVPPSGALDSASILINPYHLARPARIAVSRVWAQHLQRVSCAADDWDCSESERCVEVPIEVTNDGAVRLMIKDSTEMDTIEFALCSWASI